MLNVVFVVWLKPFNIYSLTATLHALFGILHTSPSNFANLFGYWMHGLSLKLKNQILLGVAALCWSIWLNRNDMVFNEAKSNTSMQVIFRTTYWIRQRPMLRREEQQPLFKDGCRWWETMMMTIFAKFGWSFSHRIEA